MVSSTLGRYGVGASREGRARLLLLAAALIAALSTVCSTQRVSGASGFLQISGVDFSFNGQPVLLRGVNFSNERWVYGGTIADIDVDEGDYQRLEEWGANSVRFIVTAERYADDKNRFYTVMDRHIGFARAHRLWLIPNLHVLPDGCYEDYSKSCRVWRDPQMQEAVIGFWREFAQRYAGEPVIAGYDLLNEPKPPSGGEWFGLAQRIQAAIRSVDSNHFSFVEALEDGAFPRTLGPGVAYSVHVYDPESFTHRQCSNCSYPGTVAGEQWDRARLARAPGDGDYSIQWARDNNVPLWIGEFGSRPSRGYGQYLADLVNVMNTEWRVHWSLWSYRSEPGDFGMYTCSGFRCPDQAVIGAVVPGFSGLARRPAPGSTAAGPPPPAAEGAGSSPNAPAPTIAPSALKQLPASPAAAWPLALAAVVLDNPLPALAIAVVPVVVLAALGFLLWRRQRGSRGAGPPS